MLKTPHLLRQFCRLHLRLDDLERNNVPRRFAAIVSFRPVADGEAAFAQCRAGRIIDSAGLGDYWRRRIRMYRRHGRFVSNNHDMN